MIVPVLRTDPDPPAWRIILAFLLVPAFASLVLACGAPLGSGADMSERILSTTMLYAVFGAYPATILFGLPAFALLHGRAEPTILRCAAVGAAVAAAPWLLLSLFSSPNSASFEGHATVVDGWRTAWGWIIATRAIAVIAAAGAIGGVAFWIVAAARLKRPPKAA